MTFRVRKITVDCADWVPLVEFWSRASRYREDPENPNQPGDPEGYLGATLVADHRKPDGTGWVVLADPGGNEFCVERSAAERAAAT